MNPSSLDVGQLSPEERALLEERLNRTRDRENVGAITRRTDASAAAPLSFAQQRLWLMDQIYPRSSAYNVASRWRLTGRLDRPALERSIHELVRRHETLRTHIAAQGDSVVQQVEPAGSTTMAFVDLSDRRDGDRRTAAKQLADEEALRPFDLRRGPLMRATLVRVEGREHLLLLSMHHIVSDGWSLGVFFRELSVLYESYSAGRPSPLPEPAIQYGDFAVWQRDWFSGSVLDRQLAYWKRQLGDVPVLELPLDRPRPAMQTFRGSRVSFALSRALTEELKQFSGHEGASVFMTLATAFKTLLARYSGQRDICLGTSIAGRNRVEVENVIGFFINMLVLRTNLSGDPTFREAVRRVREVTLGAYDHQDLPFEKLVEELQPPRTLSHTPLFQVVFTLHNQPRVSPSLQNLGMTRMPSQYDAAKYDLMLLMEEGREGLSGSFLYNTDLFDAATIERMAAHFECLLAGAVADPDRRLSRLPILTAAERRWYVTEANETETDPPAQGLHELFEAQARRTPEAPAVVFEGRHLTYGELDRRANQLARHLQSLGAGPEVLIGVYSSRTPEMMIALLGVLKSGAAYVPLDPTYPLDRLEFMRDDAGVRVLLTEQRLASNLAKPGVPTVCLDRDWHETAGTQSPESPRVPVEMSNLAYVIYTSGSTGKPKGVMIAHEGIVNYVRWGAEAYRATDGRGALVHSPLGFDMTLTGLFPPLVVGTSVELLREAPGVEVLARALQRGGGFSLIKITPAHVDLLNRQLPPEHARRCTGTLVVGAEALYAPGLSFWRTHAPETHLINEYGPTETVVGCSIYEVLADAPTAGPVPIGLPIANMQMYVLDRHLEPVPPKVSGELYIGGIGVARGYLNRADLTAERFVPDPLGATPGARLYRAGDLSRYLPDRRAHIEFLGRVDHQVKLRAFRIELGEIEAVLTQHPHIGEAVVVAYGEGTDDKRLVAYVVPGSGSTPTVAELRQFVGQHVPEYMVPAGFVLLDALPLTPNGKIDRRTLERRRPDDAFVQEAFVAPRDPLEARLAALWLELLDVEPIGVTDNFFEVGGHSLLAERLTARIQDQIGGGLTLSLFLQGPTIEQIAVILRDGGARAAWSPLIALRADGDRLPFFCVHSLWGDANAFAELARNLPPDQPFYAFQACHPTEIEGEAPSVEAMAAEYVDAMIARQPDGPYCIGGFSFGCPIAFEMAQQLTRQGREVELLVLFDGISPRLMQHLDERNDAVTLAGLVRDLARAAGSTLSLPHDEIKKLGAEDGVALILERAQAASLFPPERGLDWLRRFIYGVKTRTQSSRRYRPQEYDGVITLFRSGEAEPESAAAWLEVGVDVRDPLRGWDTLTTRPVDLHVLPAYHATLLTKPCVVRTAAALTACLDAAQARARVRRDALADPLTVSP